jgi:hypothetical protein
MYIFYLICIDIFINVDNYDKFINIFINYFILNIIYESIKIVHINNISIHVQIKCISKCFLLKN